MKGIISYDLDSQTQRPKGEKFYEKGEVVQIIDGVYHNGVLWYLVDENIEVLGSRVEVQLYSDLPEHHKGQFYICYRKLDENNAPIENDEAYAPDVLYFAHLSSPVIKVNHWSPEIFAKVVSQSVVDMEEKNVFVYIHGYDWQPGLKLDLAAKFVQSYVNHPENSVAKLLYFSWPSFGGRKAAEGRALESGQRFTKNGLFFYFKLLAQALEKQGQSLNLIVHSFGHQLLNGMINPGKGNQHPLPSKIFKNVFLMAPDITHLSIQKNGVMLRNPSRKKKGPHYYYNLAPLKDLATRTHIYHNSSDYLLYVSSKQSYHENNVIFDSGSDAMGVTTDYRTLGNYGKDAFEEPSSTLALEPGFEFINVQTLLSETSEQPSNLAYFPFQNNLDPALSEARKGNYNRINALRGLPRGNPLIPHHQYLFTCKAIVDNILRRLDEDHDRIPLEGPPDIVV